MHKLNLKVSGVDSSDELKLIESNLNSLEGVKEVKVALFNRYLEINLEFEDKKIAKQQIFDVIRIGGDFNIEEKKIKSEAILEPAKGNLKPIAKEVVLDDGGSTKDFSAMYFSLGLLIAFFLASLTLNVVFGYLLWRASL